MRNISPANIQNSSLTYSLIHSALREFGIETMNFSQHTTHCVSGLFFAEEIQRKRSFCLGLRKIRNIVLWRYFRTYEKGEEIKKMISLSLHSLRVCLDRPSCAAFYFLREKSIHTYDEANRLIVSSRRASIRSRKRKKRCRSKIEGKERWKEI